MLCALDPNVFWLGVYKLFIVLRHITVYVYDPRVSDTHV